MISIVVAQANNRVIGQTNAIPWYLPADLKHFKEITTGHAVIMGRKTFESILKYLGKPLPNRTNIVISRDPKYAAEGAVVVRSIDDAIAKAGEGEAMIIGGASIYEQVLPRANRIYLTQVIAEITGDTYFPEFRDSDWQIVTRDKHSADEKNQYDYEFLTLDRKRT